MLILLVNTLRSSYISKEQNDLSLQLLRLRVQEQTNVGIERGKTERSWSGLRKFRIDKKVDEGGGICSFYFTAHDGKAIPPFSPGQFLTFSLHIPNQNKPVVRCYSLSDGPHKRGTYRISVKRLPAPRDDPAAPAGLVSNYFHSELNEGDIVDMRSPSGGFYLDNTTQKPLVLIGGGVGLTPVLSMLNYLAHIKSKREVWFFYGVRNGSEHIMRDHFESLDTEHSNIHFQVCYSDPDENDQIGKHFDQKGWVGVDLFKKVLPSSNYEYYICGPQPMMESIITGLQNWGVPKESIKMEAFGAASARIQTNINVVPESELVEEYSVIFSKSDKTLKWSSESVSLLELAEANGIAMDSGCRTGNCGTCVTAVKSGELDYPDKSGVIVESGSCLACIARPTSDIVLDA